MQDTKGKVPPHNDEAELATLGALLLDNEAIATAIQYLRPGDFYTRANGRVYEAVLSLFNKGQQADILTVIGELRHAGKLDEAGGEDYIASLTHIVPSSANIAYYAQTVLEYSIRRSLLRISGDMGFKVFDESIESGNLLEDIQQKIFELSDNRRILSYKVAKDIVKETLKHIEEVHTLKKDYTGVPSGFDELDKKYTSGFQDSELIIIGARPSMGKTAIALTMASYIAVQKKIPTAFFTLEMSDQSLMMRLLSSEARIDSNALRTGFFSSSEFPNLYKACGDLYEAPLYIVDSPNMKLLDLRAQARRLRLQEKVAIIFIDYLQLITFENKYGIPQWEQVSEISRSLKSLARELKIPIVALSQLSREAEKERPNLAVIRGSGAIEQDADVVMFLDRDREAEKKGEEQQSSPDIKRINLILAKQRNGPTGLIKLLYFSRFTKFVSYEKDEV
jgi:replicative DNA helicase